MPLPEEKTVSFDLWPHLLVVEGPREKVGLLIAGLYDDEAIPRDAWTAATKERSRRTYADLLQQGGSEKIRQGMGARTDLLAVTIVERAQRIGLTSFRFSGKSKGAI
ncbi:MAG TPA: hypothetical protein VMH02_06490 [Verrucomicrobiae bacterium]|nr:hypothetical protein [Verrucomicrobiae bacterium]